MQKVAKVTCRAQVANCCGAAVSLSFERGRKAVYVWSARTPAQMRKHRRCRKICLQHPVPLSSAFSGQITAIGEHTDLGNIDYYGEQIAGKSAQGPLKLLPISHSLARQLPITEFAHKT